MFIVALELGQGVQRQADGGHDDEGDAQDCYYLVYQGKTKKENSKKCWMNRKKNVWCILKQKQLFKKMLSDG